MDRTILELLKKHRSGYVSGETISKTLGVSRTAVWKHINNLKKLGYEIESYSRKGYKLIGEPDLLTEDELAIGLSTERLGKKVICFEEIDSTNNYIKEHADELHHGTLVIGEKQNKGRGRLGREWTSPSGKGIWMSIILKPDIYPKDAPKITQIAAAALIEALTSLYDLDVKVKWPNDIVVGGKKICGILTEMGAELGRVSYIALGIGINANIDEFEAGLKDKATSLKIETGQAVNRKELLLLFLERLEIFLDAFTDKGDFDSALEVCRRHSAVVGKRVSIIKKGESAEANVIEINTEGELVVQYDDKRVESIISGEVSIRSGKSYI